MNIKKYINKYNTFVFQIFIILLIINASAKLFPLSEPLIILRALITSSDRGCGYFLISVV